MTPRQAALSPGYRGRPSAAAIYASLDEEHVDDAVLRFQAARTASLRPAPAVGQEGSWLIGIVSAVPDLPSAMHPFFGSVLAGIKTRIVASRCDMFIPSYSPITPMGNDPEAIERCFGHGAQGLIVMGIDVSSPDFAPVLESGRPIVVVDSQALIGRTGYVMSNNLEGMASAVRHLYKLGRRRIATITGIMSTRPAIDRLLGYRSELSRLGLEQRPEYIAEGDFYHHSGREQMRRLLELPDPPDAVVTASDMTAVGAIAAIEEAGLSVPDDIAIVGFDDSPFSAGMAPALTTVRQNATGLGMAAADGVLAMLDNPGDPPPAILLPTELVIRESCGIELLRSVSAGTRAGS
jgi:LacI family transcriptional regulator